MRLFKALFIRTKITHSGSIDLVQTSVYKKTSQKVVFLGALCVDWLGRLD